MKKIIFSLAFLLISSISFAQAPEKINYQAVARNLAGVPLVNQPINIGFDILQGFPPTGTIVYSETQTDTTNQFGLFTAEIGGGIPVSGNFSTINWGVGSYYLQITVNGDVLQATQLLSVPYALYAKTAATGQQGFSSLLDAVSAGATCPNGGQQVVMGLDTNANGILEPAEITKSFVICNGVNGTNGTDGMGIDSTADNGNGTFTIYYSNGTSFTTSDLTGPPGTGGYWDTINGNSITNTNSGNVGIGTSITPHKLTVVSTDTVIASFTGLNPYGSVIAVWGFNTNAVVGSVYLTGSDSGILAIDPTQKSFYMTNTTPGGHTVLYADSTVALYGKVVGNIASDLIYNQTTRIYNETDTIYSYSPSGTIVNVNQGMFLTDSLYVLGSNAANQNWVLANNGAGQAKWTDPNLITSGGDQWGSQVVVTDSTLTGTGILGNPLSVNPNIIPTQTSQLTNNSGFITSPNDADFNPTNEIQNISFNPAGDSIRITNGTGLKFSAAVPSAGQILTWNGSAWTAQNAALGTDNQDLSLAGNTLSLTNDGTPVNLTPFMDNTDAQNLINGGKAGNTQTINISGGTGTSFSIADADSLATNELITSFAVNSTSDSLVIREGTSSYNAVPLTSLAAAGKWSENAGNLYPTTITNNVGIGISNPLKKLHVEVGGVSGDGILINNSGPNFGTLTFTNNGIPRGQLSFGNGNDFLSTTGTDAFIIKAPSTGRIVLGTGNINAFTGTAHMVIENSGNVGIGTTLPNYKLQVVSNDTIMASFSGSNTFGSAIMVNNFTPNMAAILMKSSNDTAAIGFNASQQQLEISTFNPTIGSIRLETRNKISLNADTIYAQRQGGVPIFNFNRGTFFTDSLYVFGAGAGGNVLTNNGFGKAEWKPLPATTTFWSPNGPDIYNNNNTGNVGIGTLAPTAKLEVVNSTLNTTAKFTNTFTSGTQKVAVDGSATGGGAAANMGGSFAATGSTLSNYGIYTNAYGNSGTKTGINASATGTGSNIAGQFSASGGSANYALIVPSGGGNVGIGTSTPTAGLDVNSTIVISGANTNELNRTQTGAANLVPIAYGSVGSGAAVTNAGTGNWSVTPGGAGQYIITVTGETFVGNSHIMSGTMNGSYGFISLIAFTNNILVQTSSTSGANQNAAFSFVVYKP